MLTRYCFYLVLIDLTVLTLLTPEEIFLTVKEASFIDLPLGILILGELTLFLIIYSISYNGGE